MSLSDAQHAHTIYQMVSSKSVGHTLAASVGVGLIGWLTPPLTFAVLLLGFVWYILQIMNDPKAQKFASFVSAKVSAIVKWVKARFNKPAA